MINMGDFLIKPFNGEFHLENKCLHLCYGSLKFSIVIITFKKTMCLLSHGSGIPRWPSVD